MRPLSQGNRLRSNLLFVLFSGFSYLGISFCFDSLGLQLASFQSILLHLFPFSFSYDLRLEEEFLEFDCFSLGFKSICFFIKSFFFFSFDLFFERMGFGNGVGLSFL
jgi:hypothetical protein